MQISADHVRLFDRAAQQLLRAIRGNRSQIAFARRLGYRANPITDWENGRRFPTAREALRAARIARLPVRDAFAQFAKLPPPDIESQQELAAWLDALRGSRSISELARQTESSRSSVSRWLSGETEPRLPDFLWLIEALTTRLHDWVHYLVSVEQVPSLYGRFAQIEAARRLALERPWSEAVLRLLETDHGTCEPRRLVEEMVRLLGIDQDEIEDLLRELVEARIVEERKGRYRVIDNLNVDTSTTPEQLRKVRKHWAEVGARRIQEGHQQDWFAYNVISISNADSKRIEERLRAAYREVRGIVADSSEPQVAAVLMMQLVRWEDGS